MCVHGTPHATKMAVLSNFMRVGNIHCLKPCGRSQKGSWYIFVAHSLIFTDLRQRGAGNQGKRLLEQNTCSRGQLRPSVKHSLSPMVKCAFLTFSGMHAYAFLKKQAKKKAPAIGFSVPFCVKHLKGFVSALCDQSK